jgi:uncharacterized protein with PhoU and TrkA domain
MTTDKINGSASTKASDIANTVCKDINLAPYIPRIEEGHIIKECSK